MMDRMAYPAITAPWRTSSHSNPHGCCVEVAATATGRLVRDTKNRLGPALAVGDSQWAVFVAAVSVRH